MAKIENEIEHDAICQRVEELLPMTDDNTPLTDPRLIELRILSELVIEYEDEHYSIGVPSLVDVIKLRMYEMGIDETELSELLNVNPSQLGDYLSGKCEPTLAVAREIRRKLNIDADIVLGV